MLNRQPVPYFQSGTPAGDEYLAANTFLNGTIYPYPGMLGMIAQFDIGTSGGHNIVTYQLVKAVTSITPILGGVLYWSDKTVYSVTDVATATGQLAGISPRLNAAAASAFWMILEGDVSVRLIDSPTSTPDTTGKPVVGVTATAAKADVLTLATAPQPFYIGRCLSTQDGTTKLATCRVSLLRE